MRSLLGGRGLLRTLQSLLDLGCLRPCLSELRRSHARAGSPVLVLPDELVVNESSRTYFVLYAFKQEGMLTDLAKLHKFVAETLDAIVEITLFTIL